MNYQYVIDSSFRPFSMEEMITPFAMYKDAYERTEAAYEDLVDKSDKFKYLSESLPEDSKARSIYEGYANDLSIQAQDLAKHGLTMNNRRALTGLKRRYQGEIGRLAVADEAMQKERDLRRQMNMKDPSMLYAQDNLSIDDFLDSNRPNFYGISGTDLYAKAATAGQKASQRIYNAGDKGKTLGGYYRDYVETMGYTPQDLIRFGDEIREDFTRQVSVLPELQQAANDILEANGVNANLTGENLRQAQKQVIRGLIDGSVYNESHKPIRDVGVLDPGEQRRLAISEEQAAINKAMNGITGDTEHGFVFDPSKSLKVQEAEAVAKAKNAGKSPTSGTAYDVRNKNTIMIGSKTGNAYKQNKTEGYGINLDEINNARVLTENEVNSLVDSYGNITNQYLRNAIGNGKLSDYQILVIPKGSTELSGTGWFDNKDLDEDVYIILPRESKRSATENESSGLSLGDDSNVVPQ